MMLPFRAFLPHHRAWLAAILFFGALMFQLLTLVNYPPPACDEAFYARTALGFTHTLADKEIWPYINLNALSFLPHGRAYWVMLSAAFAVLGQTLFAARVVSVVGWAGLVAATYFVGRVYVSDRVGRWSAALVGVSWLSLFTSHLARPDLVAAASTTAAVGLLQVAVTERKAWLYGLLGLVITLQLDLHMNSLHFIPPLAALAALQIYRDRSGRQLAAFAAGLVGGFAIVGWIHLKDSFELVLPRLAANPVGFLDTYTYLEGEGAAAQSVLSFVSFWQRFYGWPSLLLAAPQMGLFALGLAGVLARRERRLLALAFVLVVSSITYAVVNRNYQLLGYAMWWLPLYVVLGVSALDSFAVPASNFSRIRLNNIALASLFLLYAAGNVYLTRKPLGENYQNDADALLEGIAPGSRVLTSEVWWYAMHDRVVVVDEAMLFQHPRRSPGAVFVSDAENVAEKLSGVMAPDYAVLDQVLGCFSSPESTSLALTAYVEKNCRRLKTYQSELFGEQAVYVCAAP